VNATLDVDAVVEQAEESVRDRLVNVGEFLTEALAKEYAARGHVRTWEMVKSISYNVDRDATRVKIVVGAFQSAFLEFGTVKQIARPVLAQTVEKNIDRVIEILGGE
jgi:HK97 gp10 family phage protein